jgi:hypothetical protein
VLRRIFGPRRDEVAGTSRKLHKEELRNLYSLPSIIRMIKSRRMRWAGHVARMGERNTYRLLVGKPEGKRPLGRPRWRCVNNIEMDLGEIEWCGVVDWIGLVMNLWVPYNAGELLSGFTTGGLSSSAQFHRFGWLVMAILDCEYSRRKS